MATAEGNTTDDLMCVCTSRQVEAREALARWIATPLVAAGYLLSRSTRAPDVASALTIRDNLCQEAAPLGLTCTERIWVGQALSFLASAKPLENFAALFSPIEIAPDAYETPPPTIEEVQLLQEQIEPWAFESWSA